MTADKIPEVYTRAEILLAEYQSIEGDGNRCAFVNDHIKEMRAMRTDLMALLREGHESGAMRDPALAEQQKKYGELCRAVAKAINSIASGKGYTPGGGSARTPEARYQDSQSRSAGAGRKIERDDGGWKGRE
jgi:hypothetical protein